MRTPFVWSVLAAVPGCCFFDGTSTDTATAPVTTPVDTGTANVPVVEADCDGRDDDLNGVVDDGAAPGWLTDPTRWVEVATISAGFNGSGALDLIESPDGDGVYVTVAEWNAAYWSDALVVYHLADDGTLTELGRWALAPADGYVLHAAADPDGRIWFAAEVTTTDFGLASDPLVVRFDPSDGAWDVVIDDDPDTVSIELGNVVPDADGAWFSYSALGEEGEYGWTTARISADGSRSVVDSWSLSDAPGSFDGPWLSALAPDGVLWGAGSAEDDADLTHGVVRAGLGEDSVVMADTTLHPGEDWYEGYTDLAFDGLGRWFASHNSIDPVTGARADWRVIQGDRSLPGTWALWDEVAGAGAWTLAMHPSGTVFAGGSVTVDGVGKSLLRAGATASGFVTVVQRAADSGRERWIWDVFVDEDGVVWALEGDGPVDFASPSDVRVLRLSCR